MLHTDLPADLAARLGVVTVVVIPADRQLMLRCRGCRAIIRRAVSSGGHCMKCVTGGAPGQYRGDGFRERRLPPRPTFAAPGTPEKVAELESRATAGLSLWHPLDADAGGTFAEDGEDGTADAADAVDGAGVGAGLAGGGRREGYGRRVKIADGAGVKDDRGRETDRELMRWLLTGY